MAVNPVYLLLYAWTRTLLFLPLPTSPDERLFIGAVFIGAMAILFGIHAEAVLGVMYLGLIMYFVDVLGPHPLLAAMIIGTAAVCRLAGVGGQKLWESVNGAGPETMAAIASLIQYLRSNRGGDREDE